MPKHAIIDVGSNTIRLCVYHVKKKEAHRPKFKLMFNHKVMVGLSAYVENGVLSERGIVKAADVLRGHLATAKQFGCVSVHIIATAAVRNCVNSREACAVLAARTGCPIEVLAAGEEARLGFRGASLSVPIERGCLVDIGGGSTELSFAAPKAALTCASIPMGSLSVFAEYVTGLFPSPKEALEISGEFRRQLEDLFLGEVPADGLYGIGGSIRSIAKIYGACFGCQKSASIDRDQIELLLRMSFDNPDALIHEAVRAVPDRMHTFICGCILLEELFAFLGVSHLRVCKFGLREGYLVEHVLGGAPAAR